MEVALGVDLVRSKDFNLTLNATYNFNKNNIDELMEGVLVDTHTNWGSTMRKPNYDYVIRVGEPVGLIQGFKSAGFYTVDDFTYANGVYTLKPGVPDVQSIVNYPSGVKSLVPDGQNAFPGAAKFEDIDGDGVVNDNDATIIGRTMPKHTGGFTLSGNYKSIDFSAGFTYQIGGDVYNANAMHSMMGDKDNGLGNNRLEFVKDTYKNYNIDANGDIYLVTDPSELTTLNANAKYPNFYSEYGMVTSDFIEDASYLRLQTLTIGYTFPQKWMEKIKVSNLRIYFTGSNLFCLSGYYYNAYPKARTFTFGLNLTF